MDYQMNFCAKFTARISKLSRVNMSDVKGGDTVQCYPYSINGNTIGVRKIEKGEAVGHYVRVDVRSLRACESLTQEIERMRLQSQINDKSTNLSVWLYSLEASISVSQNKNGNWYSLNLPVMVVVEEYEHNTDLFGEISLVAVNELNLSRKQKNKIKEILSDGIDGAIKDFNLLNGEAINARRVLIDEIDKIFVSENEILIPEDEVSLMAEELSISAEELFLSANETPLRQEY